MIDRKIMLASMTLVLATPVWAETTAPAPTPPCAPVAGQVAASGDECLGVEDAGEVTGFVPFAIAPALAAGAGALALGAMGSANSTTSTVNN